MKCICGESLRMASVIEKEMEYMKKLKNKNLENKIIKENPGYIKCVIYCDKCGEMYKKYFKGEA